ncbi:hypothetical protein [Wolbachia endosymbiont (group A) of Myopa testacea]|uniref:hypothetical protein n=1 Tax=Wolbachia endosymbiont (group A) of Myopa testacea TaxID=3066148 RepID=UPI003132E068
MLLRHPKLDLDIRNYYGRNKSDTPKEYIEKIGQIQKRDFSHLTMEIMEAQRGKAFLESFLDSSSMWVTQMLLDQEPNPNCWKRNQNGEIETPLSLIIKSCLQGITQENEEVLTKLLKHKDLDFIQIKPIRAIEQNSRLKKIIEQAITERLTNTINRKDLDDVKKLIEDNCFINRAIVTAALRGASELTESIKNYLNEKFPTSAEQPVADTHNVQPEINDEFIAKELQQLENLRDELEKTKAQFVEKEQELDRIVREKTSETSRILQLERDLAQVREERDLAQVREERDLAQVREERDRLSSENRLLRTKSLSNKNEKSSQAISPGKKQSNYAYAFFILSGALTVGACLAVSYDYPVIGAYLAAGALVFLLV